MAFHHFLQTVERVTPADFDLHLVLDNASTHKASLIQRWLLGHPWVRLHLTPTTGAWLNLAERWFSVHTARRLRRGRFRSTRALESAIDVYVGTNNSKPKPLVWTKTADQILESVAEFCLRTSDSHHYRYVHEP